MDVGDGDLQSDDDEIEDEESDVPQKLAHGDLLDVGEGLLKVLRLEVGFDVLGVLDVTENVVITDLRTGDILIGSDFLHFFVIFFEKVIRIKKKSA